jgi:hypothetical protein
MKRHHRISLNSKEDRHGITRAFCSPAKEETTLSSEVMQSIANEQRIRSRGRLRNGLIAGTVVSLLVSAVVWFLAVAIPSKTGSPFAPIRELCEWIASTQVGRGILESVYAFPIIEGLHLMGIALSVGVLCWLDFRLIGIAFTDQPVSKVWKQLMPVAAVGFALMFVTGGLLFWAEAITAYDSVHFWIKLGLILLAGLNALYFERVTHKGIASWDSAPVPPLKARIAGFASLILWTAVIITGRTMAYSF